MPPTEGPVASIIARMPLAKLQQPASGMRPFLGSAALAGLGSTVRATPDGLRVAAGWRAIITSSSEGAGSENDVAVKWKALR